MELFLILIVLSTDKNTRLFRKYTLSVLDTHYLGGLKNDCVYGVLRFSLCSKYPIFREKGTKDKEKIAVFVYLALKFTLQKIWTFFFQ